MTPLTCHQAEDQLELYALGECEEPLHTAVAGHVASCPRCARSLDQARQLLGLLDVEFQKEERLQKIFAHLDSAISRRRPPKRVLHFPRRLAALAALLLLAVGLGWLAPGSSPVVIVPGLEAEQDAMKLARSPVRAVVWPSPSLPGRTVANPQIPLEKGQLWVCVEPAGSEPSPVVVTTPAGSVASATGCFHVAASAAGVVVAVFRGDVEMGTPEGRVTGRPGDLLVGRPGEPPWRLGGRKP